MIQTGDTLKINNRDYVLIKSVKRGGTDYALIVDLLDNSKAIYGYLENDKFRPITDLDDLDLAVKLIAEEIYLDVNK